MEDVMIASYAEVHEALASVQKLNKDLKNAAKVISDTEARYLVDTYYQVQDYRISTANQCRQLDNENPELHEFLSYIQNQMDILENEIKKALNIYTSSKAIGVWAKSICGIGPVITAGLIAMIDIKKCPTVGHIWNYAGLNPDVKWNKGERRPWNANLKSLCFLIGQSFVKVKNNQNDFYGHLIDKKKAYYIAKNDNSDYAEAAAEKLRTTRIGKDTDAYKYYSQGKLPPAQIEHRAERYATKIFLSHLHYCWYVLEYGEKPPKPFAIEHLGHAHEILPPNYNIIEEVLNKAI